MHAVKQDRFLAVFVGCLVDPFLHLMELVILLYDAIDFGGYAYGEKNGMYYVEIADINPQDLDNAITVAVNETLTVSYSPMNYIVRMSTKGSENLQALMKALYNYHLAAEDFCANAQ